MKLVTILSGENFEEASCVNAKMIYIYKNNAARFSFRINRKINMPYFEQRVEHLTIATLKYNDFEKAYDLFLYYENGELEDIIRVSSTGLSVDYLSSDSLTIHIFEKSKIDGGFEIIK